MHTFRHFQKDIQTNRIFEGINTSFTRHLPIGIVLLVSIVLRFGNLGKQGLHFDEAVSWAVTRMSFVDLLRFPIIDPHPPLYYFLLKLLQLAIPDSEYGLRVLSAGISVASLLIVMLFVKSRWNTESMIYSGLLIAVSSFDIYYAQDARMYALLGFFWISSYISLVMSIEGERRFLFVFLISIILMAWTHAYGVIVAFMYILFILVYLFLVDRWKIQNKLGHTHQVVMLIAGTVIAILPSLVLLFVHSSHGAGGAWLPAPRDLLALFLLWTVGLSPVREYFLDSTNLVLPSLVALPASLWAAVGAAVYGVPLVWGMYQAWLRKNSYRVEVLLTVMLIFVPIALTYVAGVIVAQRVWAFKPFLGSAYLIYLWAGIGIGSIKSPLLRRSFGIMVVVIAMMSLWPYNTTWRKSLATGSFDALPVLTGLDGIIIEPAYQSPLVFYYLGNSFPTYTIRVEDDGRAQVYRVLLADDIYGSIQRITCKDLSRIRNLWVYEYNQNTLGILGKWPDCVVTKVLWGFQEDEWQQINP